jgi:hypothetical protein
MESWLASLDKEDRADAETLIANSEEYGHKMLAALFADVLGAKVSSENIRKWREKQRETKQAR